MTRDATLTIGAGTSRRTVRLSDYLDAAGEERAHLDAHAWIKRLRNLPVDGASFRERVTARGDSLWWFTEIYLHKQQVVLDVHRTIAALGALIERERPASLAVASGPRLVRHLAPLVARKHKVSCSGGVPSVAWTTALASLDLRARRMTGAAYLTPDRFRGAPRLQGRSPVAAFVHRAFWTGGDDGSAESYIGPVLAELEHRLGAAAIRYVGIGPRTNFRERRRWRAVAQSVIPVERFAPPGRLRASRAVWGERYRHFRMLAGAASLRAASIIDGVDCWPIVREELAGVAWLQWPWSVRTMDEAGAALDALSPSVVLTYAEAGGWGRALILEARRRQIPSAGLQHGFIYRHWLNYLHEPDEMPADERSGFPRPTRTLVFDDYAATHLRDHGRFPPVSIEVTGSPRLDALVRDVQTLPDSAIDDVRRMAGLKPDDMLVLVTTKEREARAVLPDLVRAAGTINGVALVIKPHPAETRGAYDAVAAGHPHVRVLPPAAPLAPLLAAARAVVTVNSTVALDAAVLDIPALAIGLPNNLSPFVDAGMLAGSRDAAELPAVLRRILYDEKFRQQLAEQRRVVLGRSAIGSDGRAAARAAEAIGRLLGPAPARTTD